MTGQKALDLVMLRLGNKTDPVLRAHCVLEMALLQETKLERGPMKPWFMKKRLSTPFALTIGTPEVALVSDFVEEAPEGETELVFVDIAGNYQQVTKKDYYQLVNEWGYAATGVLPSEYAMVGETVVVFPTPTVALTGYWRNYLAKQTAPDDTPVETTWLKYAADLLIAETCLVMASKHVRVSADKIQEYKDDAQDAWSRILRDNTARQEAGQERNMG